MNDDTISRQAAIDACLDGWNKGYEEILTDIRALPSAERHRWIPVTERLPKKEGQYLVWLPTIIAGRGMIDILHYGKPYFIGKREKPCFYACDSEWGDVPYDDVIAWMELPEPFNGEVDETAILDGWDNVYPDDDEVTE